MSVVNGYRGTFGIHGFFSNAQSQIAPVDHYMNEGTVAQLCAEILKCDGGSETRLGTMREAKTESELGGQLSCCSGPGFHQPVESAGLYEACIADFEGGGVSCVYMALGGLAGRLTLRQCDLRTKLGSVIGGDLRPFFTSEPDGIGQQLGLVLFLIALANDVGDRDARFQHVFAESSPSIQAQLANDASASYKELVKLWQRVSVLCSRVLEYGVNVGVLISGVLCPGFLQAATCHAPTLLTTKYQDTGLFTIQNIQINTH